MAEFGIGQPVRRKEDVRFITGAGEYTDDMTLPNQAHGVVLRSPMGHAKISSIDTSAAKEADGVIAVYTADDVAAAGVNPLPCAVAPLLKNKDGSDVIHHPRPILAKDVVKYVGDGVAFVVAETVNQAKNAAELIEVDYEDLPAAATLTATSAEGAPQIWDDAPGNLAVDWEMGDEASNTKAFEAAAKVVSIDLVHNRVVTNAMEPRAALGDFEADKDLMVLRTSTQGANGMRDILAGMVFGMDPANMRIITADVGGGFGTKTFCYQEHVLVLMAAKLLGRPVKWTGERSEAFLSDAAGRDVITHAEAALDSNNKIQALRVHNKANLGGYMNQFGPFIPTLAGSRILGGVYEIPNIYTSVKCYYSNSTPVDAYRGAGRPESAYIIERLVDKCAAELGMTQDAFRKLNFIPPEAFPYQHPFGFNFDTGEYANNMADAMAKADWAGFSARRAQSEANGKLRGIGLAYYIECTLGAPVEPADINFLDDGTVEIITGTMSNGQGHETAFAQIVTEELGVPFDKIKLVQGDTDKVAAGGGTGGSRSLYMSGHAFVESSKLVIEKGKLVASILWEQPKDLIDFADGIFSAQGTNQTMDIMEVAMKAKEVASVSEEAQEMLVNGLNSKGEFNYDNSTFPNGCHICEAEIDPQTGKTTITNYTVVDDFGKLVNPMIVAGQVHGGVVQGIGQALLENCVYEEDEGGQLVTGSFMDYGMPRADDMSPISFSYNEVLCKTNPMGIKGCGEAGTIGACPSLLNAMLDALRPMGIEHLDMPATPMKVWEAIQNAQPAAAAE